ncbi:lysophospholipase [bacterium]|nr:lysophospholipase [bacterium]
MGKLALLFSLLVLHGCTTRNVDATEKKPASFFSLNEISSSETKYLAPLQYVRSSDNIDLAFRAYIPPHPKAILVFYHGAGAHSGLIYNHIGVGLSDAYNIVVYTPDLRGHGYSSGPRGDSPSPEQVWHDINSMINRIRQAYPDLPLFMGGHSGGSGLVLNYLSWPERIPINGYVFIAPYFGYRSKTDFDEKKVDFTSVKISSFVINTISGGFFMGHSKAVRYNYPAEILEQNPKIVAFNTVNMSNALTPTSPQSQFSMLQRFGLWIGDRDESFDPSKIIRFAEQNQSKEAAGNIQIVKGENHFSILLKVHELIGPWILSQL